MTQTPKKIANQIQWCYDMLGKNLDGDDQATVRITLREALKDLELDEKRRAALEEVADSSLKLRNLETGRKRPKEGEYNDPHEYSKLTTAWRRAVEKLYFLTAKHNPDQEKE